jgi:hypothetical protein
MTGIRGIFRPVAAAGPAPDETCPEGPAPSIACLVPDLPGADELPPFLRRIDARRREQR